MDRFLLMHCYVRAVETGSFSAVARELSTGQPNISRNIAALEQHLGTRLLHRSTRKLTPTPEGERYYAEVRRVLDAAEEADANARGEGKPGGLLRVSCSTLLGREHLLPHIGALLGRYPSIELDLQLSDRYIDLVEGGVDLAIRIGTLEDSALRARRIGMSERVCVASNAYLARRAAPQTPADLHQHNCIVYTLMNSGISWRFREGEVPVHGSFRSNTLDGVYRAVMDGLGIGYGPQWMFEREILDGSVKMLMAEHYPPAVPINIIYSTHRLLPRRAVVFMDFIAEVFGRDPTMQEGALARLSERLTKTNNKKKRLANQ
ncbi:LysR family transcriptional regulator [Duganella sp. FT135W]|uniref:LysR family transcriptional regulator n=1 Tax=Duganella flavida TaxID=2692175 RepID=A0A6L8KJJ6_9BURK|nr:LysR family transcriptional regulator [Duganella flavida]MYM26388.1 LysR family transcriptional regulator [Duganella flavida]